MPCINTLHSHANVYIWQVTAIDPTNLYSLSRDRCPWSGWPSSRSPTVYSRANRTSGLTALRYGSFSRLANLLIQVMYITWMREKLYRLFNWTNGIGIEWKQLVSELESGFRMEKPSNAPNFIGEIMNSCWEMEPKERPTFQQLEETLSKHLHSSVSSYYLQLDIASLSNEQCWLRNQVNYPTPSKFRF